MEEAIVQCKKLKEEKMLQDMFVGEVGLSSWDEAAKILPQFTSALEMYRGSDKEKQIAFKVTIRKQYV